MRIDSGEVISGISRGKASQSIHQSVESSAVFSSSSSSEINVDSGKSFTDSETQAKLPRQTKNFLLAVLNNLPSFWAQKSVFSNEILMRHLVRLEFIITMTIHLPPSAFTLTDSNWIECRRTRNKFCGRKKLFAFGSAFHRFHVRASAAGRYQITQRMKAKVNKALIKRSTRGEREESERGKI